jgi:general secretion pathway protein A
MYTDYYGFKAKPFQLTPDPEFFFASSGHKRALAYLRYGLSQAEGFIVITGGIGTGKTTLVKSLFKELVENGGGRLPAAL